MLYILLRTKTNRWAAESNLTKLYAMAAANARMVAAGIALK
jgi:hypothetical protein